MQLIEDQLERFTDSPGHMLHAKIVGETRDCVAALASKKSPTDIVCHAGNLRKSVAAKQQPKAAIHVVGKSAAVAKPTAGKHHPAAEPPAGVAKPAAAEPPPVRLVATFDKYTTELDDGSNVLVKAHNVTVYVDRQKGIQVVVMIGKFSDNLLMGSHQKARYCWYNRRIMDFIHININSQPNLDVAMEKYGMCKQVLFIGNVTTRADPEYGFTEGNGNMPNSIWDWNSPSKDDTPKDSPPNIAKVTLTDTLKRNRKLLCKKTSPRKNISAQSRAEWLMTTKRENTRKKVNQKEDHRGEHPLNHKEDHRG
jgi:hypothetical protein